MIEITIVTVYLFLKTPSNLLFTDIAISLCLRKFHTTYRTINAGIKIATTAATPSLIALKK